MPVERGFALIAILALAALISAFLIASALNLTGAGISNEREDRSMKALREAKAALIAYAANEQWQAYKSQATDQPGGLPCPDTNNDGTAQLTCPNAVDRIGRLPYMSIGADDLRDASGERLWYAVSSNFRKLLNTTIINSDTQGLLTVTGTAPASNVVAIVFAPGPPVQDSTLPQGQIQDRSPANISRLPSYLEGFTVGANDYTFKSSALPNDTFNDRLLVITQAELMAAVEPVVAARIERDVKPLLQDYFNKWGAYPFAMTFVAPPALQSAYLGTLNQPTGLLPVTNDPASLTWSATVTSIVGSGTGRFNGTTNAISPNPTNCTIASSQATCVINYCCDLNDRPDIRLDITLNASMLFADIPTMPAFNDWNNFVMREKFGSLLSRTVASGYWSENTDPSPPGNPPTQSSFALQASGAVVTYTGRLQNSGDTNDRVTITVSLPTPSYLPRLTNTSPNPNITWFTSNQWYRQTYYAVSQNYLPGDSPPCTAGGKSPSCLTVNNLPVQNNNKRAILVFAGRALDGQNRIGFPGTLANYLEGENATPTDLIFTHRAAPSPTINDRVVVISP